MFSRLISASTSLAVFVSLIAVLPGLGRTPAEAAPVCRAAGVALLDFASPICSIHASSAVAPQGIS
jgi:hypothetical protein